MVQRLAEAPLRVLLVDDDDDLRGCLRAHLVAGGATVTDLQDPERAIDLLNRGEPFDFVLADLRMPGAIGTEVLRCSRECLPTAELALMTVDGMGEDAVGDAVRLKERVFEKLDLVTGGMSRWLEQVRERRAGLSRSQKNRGG